MDLTSRLTGVASMPMSWIERDQRLRESPATPPPPQTCVSGRGGANLRLGVSYKKKVKSTSSRASESGREAASHLLVQPSLHKLLLLLLEKHGGQATQPGLRPQTARHTTVPLGEVG